MERLLFFGFGMFFFGWIFAYAPDVIKIRLPVWARNILLLIYVKKPFLPLHSVIWQIYTYLALILLLLSHVVSTDEEVQGVFMTVTTVAYIAGIIILIYSFVLSFTNIFRIERAINLHFDREIWLSSTRKIFEDKYKYAEKRMKHLIALRTITIKTAIEIFGKQTFEHTEETPIPTDKRIPVAHWCKYDALTGREVYFIPHQYYFYAPKISGVIAQIENEIREKWKHDTEKKREFWKYRWKMGKYGDTRWHMG